MKRGQRDRIHFTGKQRFRAAGSRWGRGKAGDRKPRSSRWKALVACTSKPERGRSDNQTTGGTEVKRVVGLDDCGTGLGADEQAAGKQLGSREVWRNGAGLRLGHADCKISGAPKSNLSGPQKRAVWKQDDRLRVDQTPSKVCTEGKTARDSWAPPAPPLGNAYIPLSFKYTLNHRTRCETSRGSSLL